jgi:hypothetical protein
MKIFKNLKTEKVLGSKLVTFREKLGPIGKPKYLPSFTKE